MPSGYRQPPIEDYAIIGDCHGCALVSKEGSIDWLALLRFDEDPAFFRILDGGDGGEDLGGGAWEIVPRGVTRISRAYVPRTNLLRTVFETKTGALEVVDFMPVGRTRSASAHDYVNLNAPGWLVRRLACLEGEVEVEMRIAPRGSGFSKEGLSIEIEGDKVSFAGMLHLWCGGDIEPESGGVRVRYMLKKGQSRDAVLTHVMPLMDPRTRAHECYEVTCAFWREWASYSRFTGNYETAVERSALALKLLTYSPTGALVAAATTSLPEWIGGVRNWDYRFCWIRDATFALYALAALGYSGEAARFSDFLTRRCLREGSTMRIMYGIDGQPFLPERCLDHLTGYHGSTPVRAGNEAAEQLQLDVFGELLDWADLRVALGARLDDDENAMVAQIADYVCKNWHLADHGLWEMRKDPKEFVHGKAMAWVTLDRAARLLGDRPNWQKAREAILESIRAKGLAGQPPYLTQYYGTRDVDGALLQVPMLGLPLSDEILSATVREVQAQLADGELVHRYKGDDGLPGKEGAFMITSFWLVEALLIVGRPNEAREVFEKLLARANDVGLYSEEVHPETGAFLGNFPQAFTHLALISAATSLHLHEVGGVDYVRGSYTDRAKRLVGATEGIKGVVYSALRNGSVKIFSSKDSILAFD